MSRVQLALNVSDVDAAVEFYGKLFGAQPAKRRPGYANFAIAEPPLKLVLIETPEVRGEGLATAEQDNVCCYAVQDKVWVSDPDGAPWEVYTVLADAPAESSLGCDPAGCSTAEAGAEHVAGSTCC